MTKNWQARTKQDLIIEVWEHLDCESVGAYELEQIQEVLREKFGGGGVASPASIARVVADEGAVLRHPEVFNCDFKWREQRLAERGQIGELKFGTLEEAAESLARLQGNSGDANRSEQVRELIKNARQNVLLAARSRIGTERERAEAREISHWLMVWLQGPDLFPDWLDLRRRSHEFRQEFPED